MSVLNITDDLLSAHLEWSEKLDDSSVFPPLSSAILNALAELETLLGQIIETKKEDALELDEADDSTLLKKRRGASRKVRIVGFPCFLVLPPSLWWVM